MSTVNKGLLQNYWKIQQQFVRYRGKVNITKPKPPHYKRAVVEKLCVPYFTIEKKKAQNVPPYELCNINPKKEEVDYPFVTILAREVLNWFNHSKQIAFFHLYSSEEEENFQSKFVLHKNGMKYLTYEFEVMQKALINTMYEPVLPLFESPTVIAVCDKPDIHNLMKVNNKLPKLHLMAAIVHEKLLSYSELKYLGKIPNLETAQANLLGVLNGIPQNLIQKINHYPNTIVQLLNQHQDIMKKK